MVVRPFASPEPHETEDYAAREETAPTSCEKIERQCMG